MTTMSHFLSGAALAVLLCGTAQAQTSSLESALDNLPIEKIAGQLLNSVDFSKMIDLATKSAEKAAADVAAGKTPATTELENSPAVKEMQAQMQKNVAAALPELMKAVSPLISGLLQELKQELSSSLR